MRQTELLSELMRVVADLHHASDVASPKYDITRLQKARAEAVEVYGRAAKALDIDHQLGD